MLSHKNSVQFRVLPDNKIVESSHGESVLQALTRAKIPLGHSCGGNGTCSTCRILIISGVEKLNPRTELEQEMATDRNFAEHERLGCQTEPVDDLVIKIP